LAATSDEDNNPSLRISKFWATATTDVRCAAFFTRRSGQDGVCQWLGDDMLESLDLIRDGPKRLGTPL
jgi:hypothetical protein